MNLKDIILGDFPGGPVVKNLPSNAGDTGSVSGQGTKIPHASLYNPPQKIIRQEYFLRQCLAHTSTSGLVAAIITATITSAIMVMMIFLKDLFIYLFLVTKGLRYCPWAFCSCSEQGLLLRWLLLLQSTDSRALAQWLWHTGIWNLPGPGIDPASPALAGRFLITRPPGKSMFFVLLLLLLQCFENRNNFLLLLLLLLSLFSRV